LYPPVVKAPKFLSTLRLLLPAPPAIAAVSLLLDGKKISWAQKKAIAATLFHFISRLLPDDFARDEILVSPQPLDHSPVSPEPSAVFPRDDHFFVVAVIT
jgi:hypothetical protein